MTKQYEVAVVSELLNQKLPFILVCSVCGWLKVYTHTQRVGGWEEGVTKQTENSTSNFVFLSTMISVFI